jgi:hypothetical protein
MTSKARRRAAGALVAIACAFPGPANAQDPAPGAAPGAVASRPVALVIRLDEGSSIDPGRLREAIARELGIPVVTDAHAPGGVLVVTQDDDSVTVTFDAPEGRHEARTLAIPDDGDEAVRDVALLAANLARDQASEFIRIEPPAPEAPPPATSKPAVKPQALPAKSPCDDPADVALLGLDFAPLVGTSTVAAGRGPRRLSLGAVGPLSGGVRGLALGGALNIDTAYVCGAQIAGALNVTAGPVSGAQVAGAINLSRGSTGGLQAAGATNLAIGPWRGLQAAGAINVTTGALHGVQAAGSINVAAGEVHGAQLSGAINVTRSLRGAQVAGAINVATEVTGAQIGVVNVAAGPVHGVQVGVVNVAADSDFSLGILNVIARGRFNVDAWGLPDSGLLFAGLKNGGPHYHYIYGIGVRPGDAHRAWAAYGIGAHITPLDSVFVDIDAIAHGEIFFASNDRNDVYQLRVVAGYRFFRGLAVFAGPTANVLEAGRHAPSGVAPGYATTLTQTATWNFAIWPGAAIGLEGL